MTQPSFFHQRTSQGLKNQTLFELLDHQASKHPEKEAIVIYDDDCQKLTMTFREYQTKSQAFAAALLEKGLALDDTVAVISPNIIEYPVVLMALSRIGANIIPITLGYVGETLSEYLREFNCTAAVYHVAGDNAQIQNVISRVANLPYFKFVVTIGSPASCVTPSGLVYSYDDLLSSGERLSRVALEKAQARVQPDDHALVLMTSGSTGRPKAAQLTQSSVVASAFGAADVMRVNGASRVFTDSPFSWVIGITNGINLASCVGATLISISPTTIVKKGLAEFALRVLQDEKCTVAILLPYFIYDIVARGLSLDRFNLSCLEIGVTGGQPVPQSTMKKLLTHLPNMKVVQLYGMTEVVNSLYQVLGKDTIDRVPYGAMEVNRHLEVQVTDEGGAVLPTGWTGEINIRGLWLFIMYVNNPSETSKSLTKDGWYRTGDIGRMDDRGRITMLGRKGDLIRKAVDSCYPAEYEGHIAQHHLVAEVAVIGVPDQRFYEEVCACVILQDIHDKDTQIAELESWYDLQWPSNDDGLSWKPGYTVTFEKFPRTRTGKPDRRALKTLAMDSLGITTDEN